MAIRHALAFPFYCIAFALHLLTAMMSALSAKIAGDVDDMDHVRSDPLTNDDQQRELP